MTLDQWLTTATQGLSQASIERVRTEIQQHCESAREHGDDPMLTLGDPKAAHRAYRKVLLTAYEARFLAAAGAQPFRFHLGPVGRALAALALVAGFWWLVVVAKFQAFGFVLWVLNLRAWRPTIAPSFPVRLLYRTNWGMILLLLGALPWADPIQKFTLVAMAVVHGHAEWVKGSLRRKLPSDRWPEFLT